MLPSRIESVVIASPHTDDGEISAGGTISKFIDQGLDIHYIGFSSCEKSVPDCYPNDILKGECISALAELGIEKGNILLYNFEVREFAKFRQDILDRLVTIARELQPDLVICPSSFDTHQDHIVVHDECIRAFKKGSSIWGMEHPWNNISFRTDIFIRLSQRDVERKVRSLSKYSSQSHRDYFNERYIMACAYTRGMNIGVEFAEVFENIRTIL